MSVALFSLCLASEYLSLRLNLTISALSLPRDCVSSISNLSYADHIHLRHLHIPQSVGLRSQNSGYRILGFPGG